MRNWEKARDEIFPFSTGKFRGACRARNTGVIHRLSELLMFRRGQENQGPWEPKKSCIHTEKSIYGHGFGWYHRLPTLSGRRSKTAMNDEEMIPDEYDAAEIEKELWPIMMPEQIKEFEEELMDLDLRF